MRKNYMQPTTDLLVLHDVCTFTSYSVQKGNNDGSKPTDKHEPIDIGKVYDDGTNPGGTKNDSWYDDSNNWGGD